MAAWAIGGGDFVLPENVGLELAAGPKHFVLEMHYDNFDAVDFVGSDGFKVFTTSTLREHTASPFMVGEGGRSGGIIPAMSADDPLRKYSYHLPSQLSLGMTGDITVFAGFVHAHLAGRKTRFRQFRKANAAADASTENPLVEMPYVFHDENYDFNYQETVPLPEGGVVVKPGDWLTTECWYDTTGRAEPTTFGAKSLQEMCITFGFFYPKENGFRFAGDNSNMVGEDGQNEATATIVHFDGWQGADGGQGTARQAQSHENSWSTTYANMVAAGKVIEYIPAPADCVATLAFMAGQSTTAVYSGTADGFDPAAYTHSSFLDSEGSYKLHWRLDEGAGIIAMAAEVSTDGWIGLGFGNGKGSMAGADMIMGGAFEAQSAYFSDRHALGNAKPIADSTSSYYDIKVWGVSGSAPATCAEYSCQQPNMEWKSHPGSIHGNTTLDCCTSLEILPGGEAVRGIDGTEEGAWTIKQYTQLSGRAGEKIKFMYPASHNVVQFSNKSAYDACDVSGEGTNLIGPVEAGTFLFTIPTDAAAGDVFYFGCAVGTHCQDGQKQSVIVFEDPLDCSSDPLPHLCCDDKLYCNSRGEALVPSHSRNTSGACFCECISGYYGRRCESKDVEQEVKASNSGSAASDSVGWAMLSLGFAATFMV